MNERIKRSLKLFGPGLIIASVVLGPGSLTVATKIGASYGHSFLWIIIIAILPMLVFTSIATRYGVLHKKTLLQTISSTYGKWFSIIIGISAFISSLSFQFGNNLGIGVAVSGIFGLPEYVGALLFTLLAMILIFFAKNLYKTLEKLMMIMVMVMIISFLINLILINPNPAMIIKGFVPGKLTSVNISEAIALLGTTFVVVGAFFQSYLVQNKGWGESYLKVSLRDTKTGIIILGFISGLVIITAATVLYPRGFEVKSIAQMAFGPYSKYIFSIGFGAAAFSSLLVNAIIGGSLLSDGLGLGSSMNCKFPKIFTCIILVVGMLIAVFFSGDIIYSLILAQAFTIIGVPFIAIGLLLVANNKSIMGNYTNTKKQNIISFLGLLLLGLVVLFLIKKIIHFLN